MPFSCLWLLPVKPRQAQEEEIWEFCKALRPQERRPGPGILRPSHKYVLGPEQGACALESLTVRDKDTALTCARCPQEGVTWGIRGGRWESSGSPFGFNQGLPQSGHVQC